MGVIRPLRRCHVGILPVLAGGLARSLIVYGWFIHSLQLAFHVFIQPFRVAPFGVLNIGYTQSGKGFNITAPRVGFSLSHSLRAM